MVNKSSFDTLNGETTEILNRINSFKVDFYHSDKVTIKEAFEDYASTQSIYDSSAHDIRLFCINASGGGVGGSCIGYAYFARAYAMCMFVDRKAFKVNVGFYNASGWNWGNVTLS